MPRYYFHLYNDVDALDPEGAEFPDLAAALTHGQSEVRTMMAAMVREKGQIVLSHRIDIADGDGSVLGTVTFADAVTIKE